MPPPARPRTRATSPVIAVVLLALVTVLAAAAVGATLETPTGDPTSVTDLRLHVDAPADRLVVRHAGGDSLDVRNLRLRVRVNGEPLAHQPPVPFFAARGFRSGPTGPFNPAGGTDWRAGQRATLRLASTNSPQIGVGDRVTVTVYADHSQITQLDTTAR